ncbi:MAG: phosphate acyltransferase [Syntrophales bacterium]|nr:phosphate acyltransferase [Syntrophales bacterium]
MLRSFAEIDKTAVEKGPKRLVVLAPEDEEFIEAVKESMVRRYIEPVLIGSRRKMEQLSEKLEIDISRVEKIYETDRQAIADKGINMLFSGEVDIAGKGQIPTAYIYRAIIREEARGRKRNVSVISLWDIEGLRGLTSFTDTGVNISPDFHAKKQIINNAVYLFHVLGYPRPRVSILSGRREIGGSIPSWEVGRKLREACAAGELGACEVVDAASFGDIFIPGLKKYSRNDISMGKVDFPEIMVVPDLTTGNILVKLDFAIPRVRRRSLVMTSRGPVIIPSRSDFRESITGEIATGVVVADRIKEAAS